MRLLIVLSILFTLSAPLSYARGVAIWDYEDLVNDSDVVMIVSVLGASKRTGTQELFEQFKDGNPFPKRLRKKYNVDKLPKPGRGFKVDTVLTKFTVMAVVKGTYDSIYLEFQHYAYPEGHPGLNPFGFEWYDTINETYLVFLWVNDAGHLVPTAGYDDLAISFVKMVPDASQIPDAKSWGRYKLQKKEIQNIIQQVE